jgi:hypothetical protein
VVLHPDALGAITDASTIARGRAYVRSGRVTDLVERGGALLAEVQGNDLYRVRVTASTWACDCPAGATGALCKHCAAVVIAAGESPLKPAADVSGTAGSTVWSGPSSADDTTAEPDPAWSWLAALPHPELLDLLADAVRKVDGLAELIAREYLRASDDVQALRAEVEHVLAPRRRFYEYRHANAYAAEAEELVDVLHDLADRRPTPELLSVLERAVDLTVRTILRSDDSSGVQGDQVGRLLDAHARAATGLAGALDRAARRRLATWLHRFRFSGKQDFFEVDVDAYAQALGSDGVEDYRALVERSAEAGGEPFAVTHARTRQAILDRDADAIVRTVGGDLRTEHEVIAVVEALDQAGLGRLAVQHAASGLAVPATHRRGVLVDRLVVDSLDRGDVTEAVKLRRDHFRAAPDHSTFVALRSAAHDAGTWVDERAAAEERLAEQSPRAYLDVLLHEERDDEAWAFAMAHPQATSSAGAWERLCARRAVTAPADTMPVYRDLVESTLRTGDRRAYATAARLLTRMRAAAEAAGRVDDFRAFLGATVEANRRRPACLEAFRENGLIAADRSVT